MDYVPSDLSLFNAADETLYSFINLSTFEESLLLNILFQRGLLIHEAYFFNSSLLTRHLQARKKTDSFSLFEEAARNGLIVPAFRDAKTARMKQALALMRQPDNYGTSFRAIQKNESVFQKIMDAVDRAIIQGKVKPFYWCDEKIGNNNLGEGYEKIIRNLLQTQNPPNHISQSKSNDRKELFERVWEKSKRWRYECVEDAAKATRSKGGKGLQRTELLNSVGWSLGAAPDQRHISVVELESYCQDEEEKLTFQLFTKWIAQCHHLNQANLFGTAINFPVYNLEQDFIIDSLLRSPLDPAPSEDEGFTCEVLFPSIITLLKEDPSNLIAIRKDLGEQYLTALGDWQDEPSQDQLERVVLELKDYCKQICNWYKTSRLQTIKAKYHINKESMSAFGDFGNLISPLLGGFIKHGPNACVEYLYKLKSKVDSRDIEITLPTNLQRKGL